MTISHSAPLFEVGQTEYLGEARSASDFQRNGEEEDKASKANTLAMLPSFLGEHEVKIEMIKVP